MTARRAPVIGGLGAEHAEHGRRQQRGRRSLAGHVADDEPELAVRQIDVVEEVAADGAARRPTPPQSRRTRPSRARRRQQRLLNRGRDLQFLLELRLVERLAVEPRVLDGERRFGRQRLERRPGAAQSRSAPRSRLSRYSTPMISSRRLSRPRARRSGRAAAACTARGGCRAPPCRVELARGRRRAGPRRSSAGRSRTPIRESCGWSRRCGPDSVTLPRARASLNSSCSGSRLASMMKPRSAPVTSIAESSTSASTSSSTRPEPSARRPSSSAAIWRSSVAAEHRALFDRRRLVVDDEHDLGVARLTEPDAVAVREHPLRRPSRR